MPDRDKPTVDFNFDTWERETSLAPFAVVIGGQRYEAIDPLDLDYRTFMASGDDAEAQFKMLFPDSHTKILANKAIKLGALQEFNRRILEHYGMGDTSASSTS